jgi:hypothetical protein
MQSGAINAEIPARVANGTHLPWAEYVTLQAAQRGVSGTPSVFVAGVPVPANGPLIAAVVAEVAP